MLNLKEIEIVTQEVIDSYAILIFNVYGYEIYKNEEDISNLKKMSITEVKSLFESLITTFLLDENKLKIEKVENRKDQ